MLAFQEGLSLQHSRSTGSQMKQMVYDVSAILQRREGEASGHCAVD
jgi:hypothetical protein